MAEIFTVPVTNSVIDPLKEATQTVKEVELDGSSDSGSVEDVSVLINGDQPIYAMELRKSTQVVQKRIVSRTTRRSSRHISSESMGRAERHFFTLLDFISNASREAASLSEFWSGITEEYRTAVEERNELYTLVIELEEDAEKHKESKREHERIVQEKLRIIQRLDKSLAEAHNSAALYKRRYDDSETENRNIREELHTATHNLTHIENERNTIQNELSIALARILVIERERDSSRKQYSRLEIDYRSACQARDDFQAQRDELERRWKAVKIEVDRLTDDLIESDRVRQEITESRDMLKIEVDQLKSEISDMNDEVKEWTKKYERCKEDTDKHLHRIGELERDNIELTRSKQQIIREREQLKQQQTEYIRQVEFFKRESASWRKQFESSDYEREQLVIRNDELREQVREYSSKHRIALDDLEKLKIDFEDVKQKNISCEEQITKHKLTIAELLEEKRKLTERAECALADAREQRHLALKVTTDLTELQRVHTELQKESSRLTELTRQLEDDLKRALSGCSGHEHLIVSLRERIDLLDDECGMIQRHAQETFVEIEELRRDNTRLDRLGDDFKTKWVEKCIQVDRLLREGVYCPCEHQGGKTPEQREKEKREREADQEAEKKRKAADEAARKKKAEDDAAAKKAADDAKKLVDEEAAKKKAADDAKKLIDDEAAKKKAADDAAAKKKAEDDATKKAIEDAKKIADDAAAKKKAEEDAARKKAEDAKKPVVDPKKPVTDPKKGGHHDHKHGDGCWPKDNLPREVGWYKISEGYVLNGWLRVEKAPKNALKYTHYTYFRGYTPPGAKNKLYIAGVAGEACTMTSEAEVTDHIDIGSITNEQYRVTEFFIAHQDIEANTFPLGPDKSKPVTLASLLAETQAVPATSAHAAAAALAVANKA